MADYCKILAAMRRPPILMQAVRHGLAHYRREPALKRLAGGETAAVRALPRLFEREARLEETRRSGGAGYSPASHVEVLIALVAETRRLDVARLEGARLEGGRAGGARLVGTRLEGIRAGGAPPPRGRPLPSQPAGKVVTLHRGMKGLPPRSRGRALRSLPPQTIVSGSSSSRRTT